MRGQEKKITELDLQIDSFMLYCDAKHLSVKTLKSYEQTLTLFRNLKEFKMKWLLLTFRRCKSLLFYLSLIQIGINEDSNGLYYSN